MDANEATRIVFSRIQALDPDHAAKIMGLLLLQDHGDKEMIRLAFGPETLLHSLILKARRELGLVHSYDDLGLWGPHRRSFSSGADMGLPSSLDAAGFGWKPCLYFARGFCKNGSCCRFLHDDKLDSPTAAFAYSPTGMMPMSPSSPSASKCMNFFFRQQQQQNERAAAAATAALMLGGDEGCTFTSRSRMDYEAMVNPSSLQIYLTFPAESTFREEDVSNYFR